jgi:hypothetical protein
MSTRLQYVRKTTAYVVAVQVDLDTNGFTYRKWGGIQTCKRGDWLVNEEPDTYTVDRESFARTYSRTGQGTYVKTTPVWAEVAEGASEIGTKEGVTRYETGDYLVYNEPDGSDGYAIRRCEFERIYERSA